MSECTVETIRKDQCINPSRVQIFSGLLCPHVKRSPVGYVPLVAFWLLFAITVIDPCQILAQHVRPAATTSETLSEEAAETGLYLNLLDLHPDILYEPYMAGPSVDESDSPIAKMITSFRDLLKLYEQRQGQDDNFTIRVLDNRSGETLELFVLEADRRAYEQGKPADWKKIDEKRRVEMRRLIDKWAGRGIPRGSIAVRWGHANEVQEARIRELPFIEYEIQLARYLGLSLLTTEIGTVETFNQDHLVSSAGARGRYQMMPYLLRKNQIQRYNLQTASGHRIRVLEEYHPLLTMEPAFLTLRGYINATGHEIPGISAYHAGPGNIYKIYQQFLSQPGNLVNPSSTVVDAYIWGVTDGFDTVSRNSSFKGYSRAYVATTYGSLRAMEQEPVDTSMTMLAERVQLDSGKEIYLSQLLKVLEKAEGLLIWNRTGENASLYERFRVMNPHIRLPESEGDAVPLSGDVRLVSRVDGAAVRFFLPLGASAVLERASPGLLDDRATFRFDHDTYEPVPYSEITEWDREYEDLIRDVEYFGFTNTNRNRLKNLKERFETLARQHPTPYRRRQLSIIETHERLWDSKPWETLAREINTARHRLNR